MRACRHYLVDPGTKGVPDPPYSWYTGVIN
jgi:hypothetical protein